MPDPRDARWTNAWHVAVGPRVLGLDLVIRQKLVVFHVPGLVDQPHLLGGVAHKLLEVLLDGPDLRLREVVVVQEDVPPLGRRDVDLEAAQEAQDQVDGGLLLDVVVRERAPVLELLPREGEALLPGGDALPRFDLRLHAVASVGDLAVQGDRPAGGGLHEDLHGASALAERRERLGRPPFSSQQL
eukprot:CAMPEP_0204520966 /NCGR_PEP_ID=MMETSP0661-20131031/5535_1 /ASSEMBLY_ACC=CAM_ASM_000606 /TAXON_ID=109239 /ORGANISM="Alexandrium margalefi, Strain AMGDE01CS-322" /LENGTH=185 /DNA_ID=CAMNT_0051526539 /DNA_START=17 /DNA_END=572 /DNA_ORIENTATION=-